MSKNIYMRLPKLIRSPIANAAVSLVLQKTSGVCVSCLKAFSEPWRDARRSEPVSAWDQCICTETLYSEPLGWNALCCHLEILNNAFFEFAFCKWSHWDNGECSERGGDRGLLGILAHTVSPNPSVLFLLDWFLTAVSSVQPSSCCCLPSLQRKPVLGEMREGLWEDIHMCISTSPSPSTPQCRP